MTWSWSNIDWNGTGAMVQAIGSVAAILVAIWISRAEQRAQRRAAEEDLWDRRRAAWKTMHALVGVLGRKRRASAQDIRGVAVVLDKLDLAIFPEEAVTVLVGLHNRVAMALADVRREAVNSTEVVDFEFDGHAELSNLQTIRNAMGMDRKVHDGLGRLSSLRGPPRQTSSSTS